MPVTPKKIGFDDIRKGDTIRVVDVREVKIIEAGLGEEVRTSGGGAVLRDSLVNGATRTFQLIEREHQPIPTKRGSVIEVKTERFVLVYDAYAPTDLWVSSPTGEKVTPERVQAWANDANGFEVIA